MDDGIASGFTMRAALRAVRIKGASSIVIAVPVALPGAMPGLGCETSGLVTLLIPPASGTIEKCYDDFRPPSHDEIFALLLRAAVRSASGPSPRLRPDIPVVARPAEGHG